MTFALCLSLSAAFIAGWYARALFKSRSLAHYARETAWAISPVEDGEKVWQAPEVGARDLFPEARK